MNNCQKGINFWYQNEVKKKETVAVSICQMSSVPHGLITFVVLQISDQEKTAFVDGSKERKSSKEPGIV